MCCTYLSSLEEGLVLRLPWNLSNTDTIGTKIIVLVSEVSLFQGEDNMYLYKTGTRSSVLINEVSLFQRCPLREVPLYHRYCSNIYKPSMFYISLGSVSLLSCFVPTLCYELCELCHKGGREGENNTKNVNPFYYGAFCFMTSLENIASSGGESEEGCI